MKHIKKLAFLLIVIAVIIPQVGCGEKAPFSKTDFCLDTACEITIYDDMSAKEADELLTGVYEEIRAYEKMLSKTVEDSDIDKINKAGGATTEVSEETIDVIRTANIISWMSDGAFDITIGGVTELWDFKREDPQVPDDDSIQAAVRHVDYQKITTGGGTVKVSDSEAQLDLGGVAKGYIADRAAQYLEENGVTKAVVNLGGNVIVIGEKEENTPWNVGIERPYSDRTELIGTIKVTDATVVTSGIYERNFEQDGVLYHHVLDPETGCPSESDLEAVTVTAAKGNSGFCDALSTACLILGKEDALKLVKAVQDEYPDKKVEAALIDKNDEFTQTDGMNITFMEE